MTNERKKFSVLSEEFRFSDRSVERSVLEAAERDSEDAMELGVHVIGRSLANRDSHSENMFRDGRKSRTSAARLRTQIGIERRGVSCERDEALRGKVKRPIVGVIWLEKKGRLCPAFGDKTIAPPGVAIHWADRHRASSRRELLASMAQYLASGIFIRGGRPNGWRSEEHTSELQSPDHLVCHLLLEKKKKAT